MSWFMDTYSQTQGQSVPEIVTGKPEVLGGTAGRRTATGLGVVFTLQAVLEHLGWDVSGLRVVVQGFGKVGSVVARELQALGARIVGVSDVAGGVVDPDGLHVDALIDWVDKHRFLRGCGVGRSVGRVEILETPCDILIPAALERQITAGNAPHLDTRLIVEAANGPTTPEADAMLADRGIPVVPDILANGGGVTVSYYEWAQDVQRETWSADEVVGRLQRQMREAVDRVLNSEIQGESWRVTAQAESLARVAEASRLRAIYP
jgi:glutamate dehydrogenase (NAD(P)+)